MQNKELVSTRKELVDVLDRLRKAIAVETDNDRVQALLNELMEVNHRITILGQLIFHEQTAAIAAAAAKVSAAKKDLTAAFEQIQKFNGFLKAISSFLGVVDKVIDVAKLL